MLCSPRTRAALKYFLYGENTQLDIKRVEALASGFQSFRDIMAASHGSPDVPPPKVNYLDPTTKEALKLLFAPEGSYIQELILTEVKFHTFIQVKSNSNLNPSLFALFQSLCKKLCTHQSRLEDVEVFMLRMMKSDDSVPSADQLRVQL